MMIRPYSATSEKSSLTGRYGVDSADESGTSADAIASISSNTLAERHSMLARLVDSDRDIVSTHIWPGTFPGPSIYVEGMQISQGSLP